MRGLVAIGLLALTVSYARVAPAPASPPVPAVHASRHAEDQTVFTLAGVESGSLAIGLACVPLRRCAPRSGDRPAWVAARQAISERCIGRLPDGTILVCSGAVLALGPSGRLRALSWPGARMLRHVQDLDVAPDGSVVVLDRVPNRDAKVWRISPNAPPTQMGGAFAADEGAVAATPDGAALVLQDDVVDRLSPDGRATTVAGRREPPSSSPGASSGDGGAATNARLSFPTDLDVLADGSFVVAEGERVRHVDTDGIIRTIAGGGRRFIEGAPATSVALREISALRSAVDDALLVATRRGLLRLERDGTIHTVLRTIVSASAGTHDSSQLNTDGRNARDARVDRIMQVDSLADGAVLFTTDHLTGGALGFLTGSRLAMLAPKRVSRLAVALPASNRTLLRRGDVTIVATRTARGRLSLNRGTHIVTSRRVRLRRGHNRVKFRVRHSSDVHTLKVSIRTLRGQVSEHRLTLIPSLTLSRRVLNRMLLPIERDMLTGESDVSIDDCKRVARNDFRCRTTVTADGESEHPSRIRLRSDGLIQYGRGSLFEPLGCWDDVEVAAC